MSQRRQAIGEWGEEQACRFLERQGFQVVDRNYHTTAGEIDIVARQGGDYYFIEVKTRQMIDLANDLSITPLKRRKLAKAIRHYCYHRRVDGEVSLMTAGLIVFLDRLNKSVRFRMVILR